MKNNVEKLLEISGDLGVSIWNNVFQSLNFLMSLKLQNFDLTAKLVVVFVILVLLLLALVYNTQHSNSYSLI